MTFKNLYIAYVNPQDPTDTFTLQYKLRNNSVVPNWCERVESAQAKYTIDDPGRFYGFGSLESQQADALARINQCIDTINKFDPIINQKLKSVKDQDTLNYLHHIFEVYHGALDQQTNKIWQRAPAKIKQALADLNLLVHRCESSKYLWPRHVVTYYGLPKTKRLDDEDYALFETKTKFGTVYLNYAEIGKTLEDLSYDNDRYIFDSGFQPFQHYSADFVVRFWSDTDRQDQEKCASIKAYYDANQEFFLKKGLSWGHIHLTNGKIPLADLQYTGSKQELLKELETHQQVKEVILL
jgi:hypothetical protein